LHNLRASVASLRLLFTITPERRSASLWNRRSSSPEYAATKETSLGHLSGRKQQEMP
jgi:hypothetical protein